MKIDQKIVERLGDLITQGELVAQTQDGGYHAGDGFEIYTDPVVDNDTSHQWGISCLSLLGRVFGRSSEHFAKFDGLFLKLGEYSTFLKCLGIMRGAKGAPKNNLPSCWPAQAHWGRASRGCRV